jgi:hypothetical protein
VGRQLDIAASIIVTSDLLFLDKKSVFAGHARRSGEAGDLRESSAANLPCWGLARSRLSAGLPAWAT